MVMGGHPTRGRPRDGVVALASALQSIKGIVRCCLPASHWQVRCLYGRPQLLPRRGLDGGLKSPSKTRIVQIGLGTASLENRGLDNWSHRCCAFRFEPEIVLVWTASAVHATTRSWAASDLLDG